MKRKESGIARRAEFEGRKWENGTCTEVKKAERKGKVGTRECKETKEINDMSVREWGEGKGMKNGEREPPDKDATSLIIGDA